MKNQLVVFVISELDLFTKAMANELAKRNIVVLFDPTSTFSIYQIFMHKEIRSRFLKAFAKRNGNPSYFFPFTFFPLSRYEWVFKLNQRIALIWFESVLKKKWPHKRPIIWLSTGPFVEIINQYDHKLSVFYSHDSGVLDSKGSIMRIEESRVLSLLADIVLVKSKIEYEDKLIFNKHTYLLSSKSLRKKVSTTISLFESLLTRNFLLRGKESYRLHE